MYSKDRRKGAVVFSGADGSGKTTAARVLYVYLLRKGYDVCFHWFRGSHMLASILLRFLSRYSSFRGLCNPYYRVCVPSALRFLWVLIEFINLLPYLMVRTLLSWTCFLVCDRGVLDFVVWVSTTLNYPGFLGTLIGRFLLSLASREETVYLYANLETLSRRSDVPRDFLLKELVYYRVLSRYYAKLAVDSSRNSPARIAVLVLKPMFKRST